MVTEDPSSMENSGESVPERSVEGSSPRKKGQGKVPKKIHKAEREKLKRDQLNDLFSDLHNMLETDKQNNGKATILGDTTRILRDLLTQVDALRKENAALAKESHYVNQENNELRDEKGVLETEITELQNELSMRSIQLYQYQPNPTAPVPVPTHVPVPTLISVPPPSTLLPSPPSPPRELQLFPARQTREPTPPASSPVMPPVNPTRPQVRYAGPWTGQLLAGRVRPELEEQYSSGVEDGQDRA